MPSLCCTGFAAPKGCISELLSFCYTNSSSRNAACMLQLLSTASQFPSELPEGWEKLVPVGTISQILGQNSQLPQFPHRPHTYGRLQSPAPGWPHCPVASAHPWIAHTDTTSTGRSHLGPPSSSARAVGRCTCAEMYWERVSKRSAKGKVRAVTCQPRAADRSPVGGQQQCSSLSQPCCRPLSQHLGVPALSPGAAELGSAAMQLGLILAGAKDPGRDDSLIGCSVC